VSTLQEAGHRRYNKELTSSETHMSNTDKFKILLINIIHEYRTTWILDGFPTLEIHSQDLFELSQELPVEVHHDYDYVGHWDLHCHQLFIVRGDRAEYIKIPIKANDKRPRWLPVLVK
jgi:hypothetical protein